MTETQPTVILVHGAVADASIFDRAIPELLAGGLPVVVPAVLLRSLSGDAAYVASVIRQINGPVILVGHSYGGAVITVAGVEDNVKALVYLSAYALEEGESLSEFQGRFPGPGARGRPRLHHLPDRRAGRYWQRCQRGGRQVPGHPRPRREEELAEVLAVSQRPLAGVAFGEPASAAAWKTKPSWGSVASADHTINPDVERFGYQRAGTAAIEIDSSHLVMLSHLNEIADLIRTGITATAD
jgi:pimeloyl-ACP methyl ester carboxylesterase